MICTSVASAPRQRIYDRGLHENEPTVTARQSEHDQYLQRAEEFTIDYALIRYVFVCERDARTKEADEVRAYERPFDLRIVDVTRPEYHDPLREYQRRE